MRPYKPLTIIMPYILRLLAIKQHKSCQKCKAESQNNGLIPTIGISHSRFRLELAEIATRLTREKSIDEMSTLVKQIVQIAVLIGLAGTTTGYGMAKDQTTASPIAEDAYAIPGVDAPELAHLGKFPVGVTELTFKDPERPSIAAAMAGQGLTAPRDIPVMLWYPAQSSAEGAPPKVYQGRLPFRPGFVPENAPKGYNHAGIAIENAPVLNGETYPLVVISHGYGNWSSHFSYLGENLASKGFVVASIEHSDQPYNNLQEFQLSFGSVLINRARDQRFVIEELIKFSESGDSALASAINTSSIGIAGYSMGGYGVLNSAGAGYDPQSPSFAQIPAALTNGIMAGDAFAKPHPNIKATLAFAPWGGAPANRAWSSESLADITMPLLFISGDEDDVSGYKDGIKWAFENTKSAPRHMLVYENARHNVGGNPPPPEASEFFDLMDWFAEPVWRRDRVTAINQHFATAFFRLHLKGEAEMQSYLNVTPTRSNDGQWPIKLGAYVGNQYSDGAHEGAHFWKGFQRRVALGMQMHQASPEDAPSN